MNATTETEPKASLPRKADNPSNRSKFNAELIERLNHHPIRSTVPAILSIDEAALVLTLSRRKVCDLLATGKLKALRLGRRVTITREALEKLTGTKLA